MKKKWTDPKIITNDVAKDGYFFLRNDIIEDIWNELKKGNSILLVAPRRVGKTSIMRYMERYPEENYKLIFWNVREIDSANDFFDIIYTSLLNCLNTMPRIKRKIKRWSIKIKTKFSISLENKYFKFKFNGDVMSTNHSNVFFKETDDLLTEINNKKEILKKDVINENVILILDELPRMLNEINSSDAIYILKKLQHWRQQPQKSEKVKFILAGSVGIHYVINKFTKRDNVLNDIQHIEFNPLSYNEAHQYIDWATRGATVTYNNQLKEYLLLKIEYFTPCLINLLLDEINKQAKKINSPDITMKIIDSAFNTVVRHNDYIKDWKKRLQDYMPKEDFDFVNEILIHTARKGHISLQEIYNKAVKHNKTTDYMDFIENLEKDGYITEIEDKYQFTTPLLREFWKYYFVNI